MKKGRLSKSQANLSANGLSIQPGDSGIWVTCDRGKEVKCSYELRDLFRSVRGVPSLTLSYVLSQLTS